MNDVQQKRMDLWRDVYTRSIEPLITAATVGVVRNLSVTEKATELADKALAAFDARFEVQQPALQHPVTTTTGGLFMTVDQCRDAAQLILEASVNVDHVDLSSRLRRLADSIQAAIKE